MESIWITGKRFWKSIFCVWFTQRSSSRNSFLRNPKRTRINSTSNRDRWYPFHTRYLKWRNCLSMGYDIGDDVETSKREAFAEPGRWARVEALHAVPRSVLIATFGQQTCGTRRHGRNDSGIGWDRLEFSQAALQFADSFVDLPEGDWTRWFNRAIDKVTGALSRLCNGTHTSLHLALPRSGNRHRSFVRRLTRFSTLLVNKLPVALNIEIDLCICCTQTSVINLALLPEQHSLQTTEITTYLKDRSESLEKRRLNVDVFRRESLKGSWNYHLGQNDYRFWRGADLLFSI